MERKEMNTGKLIRDMRERKGISATLLAYKMGMTVQRIAQYERQADSKMSTIAKIADALDYEIVIRPRKK